MKTVMMADPVRYPRMTTGEIRETFLLSGLCEPGKMHVNYVDLDRAVVGFAAPTGQRADAADVSGTARGVFSGAARDWVC